MKICANPLCENHVDVPKMLDPEVGYIRFQESALDPRGYVEVDILCYLYKNPENGDRFFLCEVCHEAVTMIRGDNVR